MHLPNVTGLIKMLNLNLPSVIGLARDSFIQERTKRIRPDNSNNERRVARGKSRRRPLDESDKIVEEDRFERIFVRRRRHCPGRCKGERKNGAEQTGTP